MQPFEFPTFNNQTGSKLGQDQRYTSQYGEQRPQQNSIQGQHWQMPQKSYYSTNNYNQNQLDYLKQPLNQSGGTLGGQNMSQDIAQMGQWGQTSRNNAPQGSSHLNFLQNQMQKQQSLSWQNPSSGVNHFEYGNRQSLTEGFNPLQQSLKQHVPQQFQESPSPHVKQQMNYMWPNQQAGTKQDTMIQGQKRVSTQGLNWPNQQTQNYQNFQ